MFSGNDVGVVLIEAGQVGKLERRRVMASVYLDVVAVRIQAYLSRWPKLVGYRAASAMVKDNFKFLPGDSGEVEEHEEAGKADGVIHLVGKNVTWSDGSAAELASKIMLRLRRILPALEMEAVWGVGESYAQAYHDQMSIKIMNGKCLRSFPCSTELPFVQRCTLSGVDSAVSSVVIHGQSVAIGRDCVMRTNRHDSSESSNCSDLGKVETGRAYANDFDKLSVASIDPDCDREKNSSNHLATVYVDGNNIGRLFRALRSGSTPPGKIDEISCELKSITVEALREAVNVIDSREVGPKPCILHIMGGDDVLVSVPACRGLKFTMAYLDKFRAGTEKLLNDCLGQDHGFSLVASAGLVIAHKTYPISQTIELADELLSVAKREYAGEEASLAWTDVTRHGTNDLSRVWKLDELIEQKERLAKIVTWGKSFKSNLERHTLAEPESVAHARLLIDFHRAGVDMDANIDLKLIAALLDLSRWWFS